MSPTRDIPPLHVSSFSLKGQGRRNPGSKYFVPKDHIFVLINFDHSPKTTRKQVPTRYKHNQRNFAWSVGRQCFKRLCLIAQSHFSGTNISTLHKLKVKLQTDVCLGCKIVFDNNICNMWAWNPRCESKTQFMSVSFQVQPPAWFCSFTRSTQLHVRTLNGFHAGCNYEHFKKTTLCHGNQALLLKPNLSEKYEANSSETIETSECSQVTYPLS